MAGGPGKCFIEDPRKDSGSEGIQQKGGLMHWTNSSGDWMDLAQDRAVWATLEDAFLEYMVQ